MQAPPLYRILFDSIQACSGLRGDFDRIRWYVYDEKHIPGTDDRPAQTFLGGDKIALARPYLDINEYISNSVVMHEELHVLIGRGGHPPVFNDLCGQLLRGGWHD